MRIQQLNKSDPEKIFLAIRNMSGATMTAHGAACLDCATTVDGVSAIEPATGSLGGWVGIIDRDIANTGYGKVQAWGYRASVLLSTQDDDTTVNIGDAVFAVNSNYGCFSNATNLSTLTGQAIPLFSKYVVALATSMISGASAPVYIKGLIRCL